MTCLIHEPINTVKACYKDAKVNGKSLFAIYYDISKAYDTIHWTSIERSLRQIGAPQDFIEYVMNTHKNTFLAMKTNRTGRITNWVKMRKAIKQGCPLAPLLFTIIMNDLHKKYREADGGSIGYRLGETRVTSRGYCDDTVVLCDNVQHLAKLNEITHDFFKEHRLNINEGKTKFIGDC